MTAKPWHPVALAPSPDGLRASFPSSWPLASVSPRSLSRPAFAVCSTFAAPHRSPVAAPDAARPSPADHPPVQYFLRDRNDAGAAVAVLVLHSLFLALMTITYLRVLIVINTNPGVVPLPAAVEESRKRKGESDVEALYNSVNPDMSPDSPGLERFYSKDLFVCSNDGRPIWCSACGNWKPDRAHHSSEMNRCVRKMDHYCPWVGGMVSETCKPRRLSYLVGSCLADAEPVSLPLQHTSTLFSSPSTPPCTVSSSWAQPPTC